MTDELQSFESERAGEVNVADNMRWCPTFHDELRGFKIITRDDGATLALQTGSECLGQHLIVIHDQHELRFARQLTTNSSSLRTCSSCAAPLHLTSFVGVRVQWQKQMEDSPFAHRAFGEDVTAVLLHHVFGKSESHAVAERFGREKRLKDTMQRRRGNA